MTAVDMTNIVVPKSPIEADYGQWAIDHPECDSIIEQIGTSPKILVYAYATSKNGNKQLMILRNMEFEGKEILLGVTIDGIRRLV